MEPRQGSRERSLGEWLAKPGRNDVPARGAISLIAPEPKVRRIMVWGLVPIRGERERLVGILQLPFRETLRVPVGIVARKVHWVGQHSALIPVAFVGPALDMPVGSPLAASEAIPTVIPTLVGGIPRGCPP